MLLGEEGSIYVERQSPSYPFIVDFLVSCCEPVSRTHRIEHYCLSPSSLAAATAEGTYTCDMVRTFLRYWQRTGPEREVCVDVDVVKALEMASTEVSAPYAVPRRGGGGGGGGGGARSSVGSYSFSSFSNGALFRLARRVRGKEKGKIEAAEAERERENDVVEEEEDEEEDDVPASVLHLKDVFCQKYPVHGDFDDFPVWRSHISSSASRIRPRHEKKDNWKRSWQAQLRHAAATWWAAAATRWQAHDRSPPFSQEEKEEKRGGGGRTLSITTTTQTASEKEEEERRTAHWNDTTTVTGVGSCTSSTPSPQSLPPSSGTTTVTTPSSSSSASPPPGPTIVCLTSLWNRSKTARGLVKQEEKEEEKKGVSARETVDSRVEEEAEQHTTMKQRMPCSKGGGEGEAEKSPVGMDAALVSSFLKSGLPCIHFALSARFQERALREAERLAAAGAVMERGESPPSVALHRKEEKANVTDDTTKKKEEEVWRRKKRAMVLEYYCMLLSGHAIPTHSSASTTTSTDEGVASCPALLPPIPMEIEKMLQEEESSTKIEIVLQPKQHFPSLRSSSSSTSMHRFSPSRFPQGTGEEEERKQRTEGGTATHEEGTTTVPGSRISSSSSSSSPSSYPLGYFLVSHDRPLLTHLVEGLQAWLEPLYLSGKPVYILSDVRRLPSSSFSSSSAWQRGDGASDATTTSSPSDAGKASDRHAGDVENETGGTRRRGLSRLYGRATRKGGGGGGASFFFFSSMPAPRSQEAMQRTTTDAHPSNPSLLPMGCRMGGGEDGPSFVPRTASHAPPSVSGGRLVSFFASACRAMAASPSSLACASSFSFSLPMTRDIVPSAAASSSSTSQPSNLVYKSLIQRGALRQVREALFKQYGIRADCCYDYLNDASEYATSASSSSSPNGNGNSPHKIPFHFPRLSLRKEVRLRPYQVTSLDRFRRGQLAHQGVVVLPCGAGKTLTGIAAAATLKKRTLVVCVNHMSVFQWQREFLKWTELTASEVTVCTSKVKQLPGPVFITTYNMLVAKRPSSSASGAGERSGRRGRRTKKNTSPAGDDEEEEDEEEAEEKRRKGWATAISGLPPKGLFSVEGNEGEGGGASSSSSFASASMASLASCTSEAQRSEVILHAVQHTTWGLLVLDEVHTALAHHFQEVLNKVAHKCVLGLSATLLREDDRISDLRHLVGPKLYEANWLDLSRAGYLAKVECAEIQCSLPLLYWKQYMAILADHEPPDERNNQVGLPSYIFNPTRDDGEEEKDESEGNGGGGGRLWRDPSSPSRRQAAASERNPSHTTPRGASIGPRKRGRLPALPRSQRRRRRRRFGDCSSSDSSEFSKDRSRSPSCSSSSSSHSSGDGQVGETPTRTASNGSGEMWERREGNEKPEEGQRKDVAGVVNPTTTGIAIRDDSSSAWSSSRKADDANATGQRHGTTSTPKPSLRRRRRRSARKHVGHHRTDDSDDEADDPKSGGVPHSSSSSSSSSPHNPRHRRRGNPMMGALQNIASCNPVKLWCTQALLYFHTHERSPPDKVLIFCDYLIDAHFYAHHLHLPLMEQATSEVERENLLRVFQHSSVVNAMVLTRVGDVALDLPNASVVIQISGLGASRRQEAQRLGRILRPKPLLCDHAKAYFYSLVSQDTHEVRTNYTRQSWLRDQGFAYRILTAEKVLGWFLRRATEERREETSSAPSPPALVHDPSHAMVAPKRVGGTSFSPPSPPHSTAAAVSSSSSSFVQPPLLLCCVGPPQWWYQVSRTEYQRWCSSSPPLSGRNHMTTMTTTRTNASETIEACMPSLRNTEWEREEEEEEGEGGGLSTASCSLFSTSSSSTPTTTAQWRYFQGMYWAPFSPSDSILLQCSFNRGHASPFPVHDSLPHIRLYAHPPTPQAEVPAAAASTGEERDGTSGRVPPSPSSPGIPTPTAATAPQTDAPLLTLLQSVPWRIRLSSTNAPHTFGTVTAEMDAGMQARLLHHTTTASGKKKRWEGGIDRHCWTSRRVTFGTMDPQHNCLDPAHSTCLDFAMQALSFKSPTAFLSSVS